VEEHLTHLKGVSQVARLIISALSRLSYDEEESMTAINIEQAVQYYKSGKKETATRILLELSKQDPKNVDVWYAVMCR
jgi:Tfp pilus assembly protein PilF